MNRITYSNVMSAFRKRKNGARLVSELKTHQNKNERSVIVLGTPTHGNLGDHAIVEAQVELISDVVAQTEIFEIPRTGYEAHRASIGPLIRPDDLIVIDGGGNVGTLWPEENEFINDIIGTFRDNHIIVFPQTAFFDSAENGVRELETTGRIFSSHRKLIFLSRDQATFDTISAVSPTTENHLVPDIVPYIETARPRPTPARTGALVCLRNDKEKVTRRDDEELLSALLANRGLTTRQTSTLSETTYIDNTNRGAELRKKWAEFSSAEIVVTDRLHGMIFSAITGTPCIALDNISHKVALGAHWLQDIPSIAVVATAEEAADHIDRVLGCGPQNYRQGSRKPLYDAIKEMVANAVR